MAHYLTVIRTDKIVVDTDAINVSYCTRPETWFETTMPSDTDFLVCSLWCRHVRNIYSPDQTICIKAALAHLGERQTEVHFCHPLSNESSGGTVFDPQKRHSRFSFAPLPNRHIGRKVVIRAASYGRMIAFSLFFCRESLDAVAKFARPKPRRRTSALIKSRSAGP
jgi:hypothetical protein